MAKRYQNAPLAATRGELGQPMPRADRQREPSERLQPHTAPDHAPGLATALDVPPIADIKAYIDTLGMSFRHSKGLMAAVRKIIDPSKVRMDPIGGGGEVFGSRYTFHQPQPDLLGVLDKFGGCVSRFDVAFDVFPRFPRKMSIKRLAAMIRANVILNWRRPQPMFEIGGTIYWTEEHRGEKRPDRNLAEYHDLPSKLDGRPTVHLELRLQSSDAAKAENIHLPSDIGNIDPKALFDKHLSLIDFQQHMHEEIKSSDHSHRVSGFYQRFYGNSVQQFKHQQPKLAKRLERIDPLRFNIDDKLTWGANSGSKDHLTWVQSSTIQHPSNPSLVTLEHPSSALIMQPPARKSKP